MNKLIGVTLLSVAITLTGCSSGDPTSTDVSTEKIHSVLPYTDAEKTEEYVVENVTTDFWPEAASFQMREGIVTKIKKGDLVEIDTKEDVRLLGIKTSYDDDRTRIYHEIPEEETIQFLNELILNKKVYIEQNPEYLKDENGNTLAYLWVGDAEQLTNINALLLKEGLALTERMDPASVYDASFKKVENEARENQSGLWKNEN